MQHEVLGRRQPAYKTVTNRFKMRRLFGLQLDKPLKRLDTGVLKCKAPTPYQAGAINTRGMIFFFRKKELTT